MSVILPTRSRPAYLAVALKSALDQTFRSIEVLVLDNAGDPPADAVAAEFHDDRVVVRRHNQNIGVAANVASGLAEATGDYVAILSDDDVWYPELLESLVRPMEEDPSICLAFAAHEVIDAVGRPMPGSTERLQQSYGRSTLRPGRHQPFVELALVSRSANTAIAAVMRKTDLPPADTVASAGLAYDICLAYQLSVSDKAAWYEPKPLAAYRLHGGMNTWHASSDPSFVELYAAACSDARLRRYRDGLTRVRGRLELAHGIAMLRAGNAVDARTYLRAALRHAPSAKAAVALALSVSPSTIRRRFEPRDQGA